jgi:hypothetical protein
MQHTNMELVKRFVDFLLINSKIAVTDVGQFITYYQSH